MQPARASSSISRRSRRTRPTWSSRQSSRTSTRSGSCCAISSQSFGDTALIATNTSSIKLEDMAPALRRPQRFVGLHFFNPVASLPLVEVIRGRDTDAGTLRAAASFVIQIGKLPLPCRSAPGFVVNRILTPYMLEALTRSRGWSCARDDRRSGKNFRHADGPGRARRPSGSRRGAARGEDTERAARS